MKKNNSAYAALAPFYERLATEDYSGWGDFAAELIGKYAASKKGADAACGSGYFTRFLKKRGYDVYGCDISGEMLTQAAKISAEEGVNVKFIQQDLSKFKSTEKLGFVTVINDGFNYLDGEKLKKAFKAIRSSQSAGGSLIFDISSEYKLRTVIGNNVFCYDGDDVSYIWFNTLSDESVTMELSVFERKGNFYEKREEVHKQYIHGKDFVLNALKECGFNVELVCGALGEELTDKSERIVFVAVKE